MKRIFTAFLILAAPAAFAEGEAGYPQKQDVEGKAQQAGNKAEGGAQQAGEKVDRGAQQAAKKGKRGAQQAGDKAQESGQDMKEFGGGGA